MKRLLIPALALTLFFTPAAASAADLVLRSIDISIGVQAGQPPRARQPEVVYVYDQHDRRGQPHRRHWKDSRRQWRQDPRVIVIDRDSRRHCDSDRVVVTRPGTVVVVADGRRW